MVEKDRRDQRKTEEILEELNEIIQPVLVGDRRGIDILSEVTNPMEGKSVVYFFPVSGVLGERGKQVLKRLREEYGIKGLGFGDELPRRVDSYSSEKVWYFLTKLPGIVFARQEVFDNKRGSKSPLERLGQ
jgi:hypothetical protein